MTFLAMGNVYGTLMNFRSEHEALAPRMHAPPYQAPPRAPVLYLKPANTWSQHESPIFIPAGEAEVEVGATVGMVMKAPGQVAGYVLMNDVSLPQADFHRPPVKANCRDGFLAVGPTLLPAGDAVDPSRFEIQVSINGTAVQTVRFDALVRPAAQLLADVGEFMTLQAGDVLLLGCDSKRPRVRPFDHVELSGEGLGRLSNIFVPEVSA